MAITGVILVGFAIGHLVGNLQIFEHPDKINGYAQFLHQTGGLIWAVRLVLLAVTVNTGNIRCSQPDIRRFQPGVYSNTKRFCERR